MKSPKMYYLGRADQTLGCFCNVMSNFEEAYKFFKSNSYISVFYVEEKLFVKTKSISYNRFFNGN